MAKLHPTTPAPTTTTLMPLLLFDEGISFELKPVKVTYCPR
jgi:hypothetical protein